jgi:thiamine biosynthesis lipoprotein
MNRRDVLRFLGAGAAVAAGYGAVAWLDGALPLGRRGRLLSQTRLSMGTFVSVSVLDSSPARAEEAVGQAFATLDRLEAELTRYRPGTALSVLNAEGRVDGPPQSLLTLLDLAAHSHRITGGAFDPTVQPVLAYLERTSAEGRLPDARHMEELRPLLGFGRVRWDGREVRLERGGMALTLNAVGKGHIVDQMVETLRRCGVRHGLVNAGGDLRAFGGKGQGTPWTIALRDPANPGRSLRDVELFDGACATTGDYEVFFDREKLFHHVVDPATAQCPHWAHAATVVAESTALADSLSTALMVLGPAGLDTVSRHGRVVSLVAAAS